VRDDLASRSVQMFPSGAVEMFPAETAQSMFDFRADDVVGLRLCPWSGIAMRISPCRATAG
jgi:hypothetical protein